MVVEEATLSGGAATPSLRIRKADLEHHLSNPNGDKESKPEAAPRQTKRKNPPAKPRDDKSKGDSKGRAGQSARPQPKTDNQLNQALTVLKVQQSAGRRQPVKKDAKPAASK